MLKRFVYEKLSKDEIKKLRELGKLCRGDILKMTTLANSGHPGGSFSSIDIYLVTYKYANIDPTDPYNDDRDRIIVSHGHTSPGVYSILGRLGFVDIDEVISGFRNAKSPFEGHITRGIPGVEWTTGNLGQGLSAGVAFAMSAKLRKRDYYTFTLMSDAEQAKGQVAEARRLARKYNLNNLTVVIDYNDAQISGRAQDIMYVNIIDNYKADGWIVYETNGHDYEQLYNTIKNAVEDSRGPTVVVARTLMGKGVSFMENDVSYHGKPLNREQLRKALEELGLEDDLEKYEKMREELNKLGERKVFEAPKPNLVIDTGKPILYTKDDKTDNRTAFGKALADLAKLNNLDDSKTKLVVVDCDLKPSVKTNLFEKVSPDYFIQTGVQEHNAAAFSGALSTTDLLVFFADFGVFGIDETYNQQRLNDINKANLKVAVTHVGIDVGEDGKTHHCVDYIGALRNLYHFKLIVPADPNQTDRAVRYMAKTFGNFAIAMGRSKIPVILKEDGTPFFDENYEFEYGKIDVLRDGEDGVLIVCGQMAPNSIEIWQRLKNEGINLKVLNISTPLHPDVDSLKKFIEGKDVFVYEDHNVNSGLGSILADLILTNSIKVKSFKKFGLPDYAPSGSNKQLLKWARLDVESMCENIKEVLNI